MAEFLIPLLFFGILTPSYAEMARGVVYLDSNKNGKREKQEKLLPDVLVSNGKEVVSTDRYGRWSLEVTDDTGIFVIKPAEYAIPVNQNQIPQHFYLHKPQGSPPSEVDAVAPTGNLPESIDFPLWPLESKSENFKVLLFGDPQARGIQEVNYIMQDVVQECIGSDAAFGISLGDIVADDPMLFAEISAGIGKIGIPWYNVFGNHDNNRLAKEDRFSDETFELFFGPSTYAFEHGQVSFIILKNIYFPPGGGYKSLLIDEQLVFIRNYLARVPDEKLVMLLMHAPIISIENKKALFSMLEKRKYTLSVAGHTHRQAHLFLNQEHDWYGSLPHHHFINATVSGSWWCGIKDELGIPHAVMNDGGPNGYSVIEFSDNEYKIRFKAARRPADYQMNIYLADEIKQDSLGKSEVLVNVFAGSEKSEVEMEFDHCGDWITLENTVAEDPACLRMHNYSPFLRKEVHGVYLDEVFGWAMDAPSKNRHMWKAGVPADLKKGTHLLTVKTTDMFGETYLSHKIFRVL